MKHKQGIYIDTSVAGGYFDKEFSEATRSFFDRVKNGEVILIVSSLLENELLDAPVKVRNLIKFLSGNIEKTMHRKEAENLAEQYLAKKVVGRTSIEDCRHIA